MAGIASHLLEFPPERELSPVAFDMKVKDFIDSLAKVDPAKILKADSQQDLLQVLDPRINSISYLWVLHIRLRSFIQSPTQADPRQLLMPALQFMQSFDSVQMRYMGAGLRETMEMVMSIAGVVGLLPQVVNPLIAAIFRIDPSSGTLTTTHIKLLQTCLKQRMFREALPILECTIHSFPPPKNGEIEGKYLSSPHTDSSAYITEQTGFSQKLDTCDVHEFFLLGGMINIALQRWEDARLYLECVLVSPSQGTPSSLQVEAYKKWVLVCCILKGTTPEAPKAVNQNMLRAIRSIAKAYDTVVEIFITSNSQRLQAEVAAGTAMWFEDGNTGLIQLLFERIPRFHILSMQETYSAVPLSTVSSWLNMSPDNLHAFIERMVSEGILNADINLSGNEPVLRFYSNQSSGPLAKTEKQYTQELIGQTKRTNAMAEYVKMSDRRLNLTKEYVEALRKRSKRGDENGMAATGEPLDDPVGMEEDIMMDD